MLMQERHLDHSVHEDKGDDEPEHELGLADVPDSPSVLPVPPKQYECREGGCYFSNLLILFCMKVSGAPERSASASMVESTPPVPCTLFTARNELSHL